MISRSMMTEAKESCVVDASADGVDAAAKSPQGASTSRSGSAKLKKRGRSPPSPKKPFGAHASIGEVQAGPAAPDSSNLDNLKEKLDTSSPKNAPGNAAEAEMLGHIRSTSGGLADVVDSMAELNKSLSVAVSASKVEKSD